MCVLYSCQPHTHAHTHTPYIYRIHVGGYIGASAYANVYIANVRYSHEKWTHSKWQNVICTLYVRVKCFHSIRTVQSCRGKYNHFTVCTHTHTHRAAAPFALFLAVRWEAQACTIYVVAKGMLCRLVCVCVMHIMPMPHAANVDLSLRTERHTQNASQNRAN